MCWQKTILKKKTMKKIFKKIFFVKNNSKCFKKKKTIMQTDLRDILYFFFSFLNAKNCFLLVISFCRTINFKKYKFCHTLNNKQHFSSILVFMRQSRGNQKRFFCLFLVTNRSSKQKWFQQDDWGEKHGSATRKIG